jgi:hypothetical protein
VREDLSVTSLSVTVTPAITAPCGSVAVPTTVPALVACEEAYFTFKNEEAKSRVISTVNTGKQETGRRMWSPPKKFLSFSGLGEPGIF